jgi:hypothetical protein
MYRTAALTRSWGCVSRSGPGPYLLRARWLQRGRDLEGADVRGVIVRRHANGGDPDTEGPIRLLIEPE